MRSNRDLTALAAGKTALRKRITRRRAQCVAAATRAVRPLAWLDRAVALCRRISPFVALAAVPLGVLLLKKGAPTPRKRVLGSLLRWGPMVFGAIRGFAGTGSTARRR